MRWFDVNVDIILVQLMLCTCENMMCTMSNVIVAGMSGLSRMCRVCFYTDYPNGTEEYQGQFELIRMQHEYESRVAQVYARKEARIDARFHAIHCTDGCGCEWRNHHNKS